MQFLVGFVFAVIISGAAFASGALSRSGALAAALLGALVYGLGGLEWAVLLVAFFASSSLLSRLAKWRKAGLEADFAKSGRRDAGQVLANGGLAGVMVVVHAVFPQAGWSWWAFVGALAAANADTWATELGVLSRGSPRLITTGKGVARGTSGAVSGWGLMAALAGAGFIAFLAGLLAPQMGGWGYFLRLAAAGLVGSLVDSLLGATIQAIYRCPACDRETERHPLHSCGRSTVLVRGWPWMNNDWVNLFCTLTGALISCF